MRPRDLHFNAANSPSAILRAIGARAAGGRKSPTPPALRQRGIRGLYFAERTDGRFQLYWNYPGMAYRVICAGRVSAEGGGSRVEVRLRLQSDLLVLPAAAALLMLGSMVWTGRWNILGFGLMMLGVGFVTWLVWLLTWHPAWAEEEASELEAIVLQASGPLLPSRAAQAAV